MNNSINSTAIINLSLISELAIKIRQSVIGDIIAVSDDSRSVVPGTVFLAWKDEIADRRLYIQQAINKGAIAVIWQEDLNDNKQFIWQNEFKVVNFTCADLRQSAGYLADLLLKQPSAKLSLIAITGTNGKTSIGQWIARSYPQTCAYIGTLGAGVYTSINEQNINDNLTNTGFTTPEAATLTSFLAKFIDLGARACALEASSIGIEEGRLNGSKVDIAIFTNLTQDHLDYHLSMENYAKAKEKLFTIPQLRLAIINIDDPFGRELLKLTTAKKIIVYSLQRNLVDQLQCDNLQALPGSNNLQFLLAENIIYESGNCKFTLNWQEQQIEINSQLYGDYNIANLLAVAAVLIDKNIELAKLARTLAKLQPVAGRMESFGEVGKPLAIVDYAHTPDALKNVLTALRPVASARGGRLLCLFGCGGNRDNSKRPIMGEIANQLADHIWVTSDNPRHENPEEIIKQILVGIVNLEKIKVITNRQLAISDAFIKAKVNDVLIIAGKGHEDYQEIMGEKILYSDIKEVQQQLAIWSANK